MNDIVKKVLSIDLVRVATAMCILLVFMFINYALVFITIPEGNREIVHNMVGIIEGTVMTVVGYEFGSSKGQQPKNDKGDVLETTDKP